MKIIKSPLSLSLLIIMASCSQEQEAPPPAPPPEPSVSTADVMNQLVENMGGLEALQAVDTITLKGDGTRTRLGQIQVAGGDDPMASLLNVTETIDLEYGRAAFDDDIQIGEGGFSQHRTEVLTTYKDKQIGWGTTSGGRPNEAVSVNGLFSWATQNSPEMLLRRNIITVVLEAQKSVSSEEIVEELEFNGKTSLYGTARINDEGVDLYFDPGSGMLAGFVTLDTETMLGDVEAQYILDDYRPVGNLILPHSVTINKDGEAYSSINYTSIMINEATAREIFTLPVDVLDQAEQVYQSGGSWAPIHLEQVAGNVYQVVAFSHNSMLVVFPSFVAVVEGAYTEAQSLTLARMVEAQFSKPIRYVIPSHPHYDHTGGIRGLAAVGATVLVAGGHEAELRKLVESPHTNPPDALARRKANGETVGAVEVYNGKKVITEGDVSLELYEVTTIPHVNPKTLAYVPGAGALFQSDIFFGAGGPGPTALREAIRSLGLDVKYIVGGHGGTLPFSSLEDAVAGQD